MTNLKHLALALCSAIMLVASCSSDGDEVILNSEKAILEFAIGSKKGVISETGKTISISLPYGTSLTSHAPAMIISSKATISPKSGDNVNLSEPVIYTVTAENGDTQKYTVSATVELNGEAEITSFSFIVADVEFGATIDNAKYTIAATLPFGVDLKALAPIIAFKGVKTTPNSGIATDFTKEVKYIVEAANGDKVTYAVTVKTEDLTPSITTVTPKQIKAGESITLTGSFAKSGNVITLKDFNSTVVKQLKIVSESETSIVAKLEETIAIGEYLVYASYQGKESSSANDRVVVVETTDPTITSMKATSLVQGYDPISISGVNFKGTSIKVYYKLVGATEPYAEATYPYVSNNNTVIGISKTDNIKVGKQTLYAVVDGFKTNEFAFEVVANTNPKPVIATVTPTNPTVDDEIVLTGTNLGDIFTSKILVYLYSETTKEYEYWNDWQLAGADKVSVKLPKLPQTTKFKLAVRAKGVISDMTQELVQKQ